MKKDIENREDIKLLVDEFYKKVIQDPEIGPFFTDAIQLSWDRHIPILYSFWETVLFGKGGYKGNPVIKHLELNRKIELKKEHFHQWKKMFFETLDEHFDGATANDAKKKVEMMESLILHKLEMSGKTGFIQ